MEEAKRTEFLDQRRIWIEIETRIAIAFAQALLLVSAAAIPLSVPLLDAGAILRQLSRPFCAQLWILCWCTTNVLLLAVAVATTLSLYCSMKGNRQIREELEDAYVNQREASTALNCWFTAVRRLNSVSVFCFVSGLIGIVSLFCISAYLKWG